MNCSKNKYENLSDIVDRFANDQQYWSGYSDSLPTLQPHNIVF